VIEPNRPRTRDGPARVAASSRPVGSRLDRAGRIDTRRRALVAPSASTSRDARSRADRRAFAAANGSGGKLANRDSARDSRCAPKRNDHPRLLRVHAKMKKTDTSLRKKKKVSDF